MRAHSAFLLLMGAWAVAASQLTARLVAPVPHDVASRYLETVHHEKPSAFYPLLKQLTGYQARPKFTWADPAFASSKGLDGKPRPSRYANHNPIFTRLAQPYEVYQVLDLAVMRSRLFRERGEVDSLNMALAGSQALPVLNEMRKVWQERDAELEASGKNAACESWIDVAGTQVCNSEQFWKTVGVEQVLKKTPIKLASATPQLYPFDRLLPTIRDDSLPLVVLYGAPSDEAFPGLFELLHGLASPRAGAPRLQFALRWKPDTGREHELSLGHFAAEAEIKEGVETLAAEPLSDLSMRASTWITQSENPFGALSQVASSLPLLLPQLSSIPAANTLLSVSKSLSENNFVTLNGILISTTSGLEFGALLEAMRINGKLMRDISSVIRVTDELAKSIVINSSITFEEPKKTASGLAVPTESKPLRFVNLAQAFKGLSPKLIRASFLEGVSDESAEVDPPAVASFFVVTDLESEAGRKLAQKALKFLDNTPEVRLAFLHNPSTSAPPPHAYAFSSLLYTLASSNELHDVYPSELLEFLKLEAGPDGPKRSLDDIWKADNPLTPFIEGGAKAVDEKEMQRYWKDAETLIERLGVQKGESAVVLNGRVIELDGSDFATGSFHNLHQYELRRRIRPVVDAAVPALPEALKQDRLLQAELICVASSVIAAAGVTNRQSNIAIPAELPSITFGNASIVPMYDIVAVLDPTSAFARSVVPALQALSHNPLVWGCIFLAPSTSQPSATDLKTLHRRSFPLALQFDAENLSEKAPVVDFSGLPAGAVVDVKVAVDGDATQPVGGVNPEGVVIGEGPQELVFAKIGDNQEAKGSEAHVRDEL
ncbi:hypothetical protein JCM1841_000772 [Sporobolomyces salmonicolor]